MCSSKDVNLWFLYETLNEECKLKIVNEIENKVGNFLAEHNIYTEQEMEYMIYDEVIRGYYLNLYLGQSVETVSLREYIVRSMVKHYLSDHKVSM